jgi:hypothetical protein
LRNRSAAEANREQGSCGPDARASRSPSGARDSAGLDSRHLVGDAGCMAAWWRAGRGVGSPAVTDSLTDCPNGRAPGHGPAPPAGRRARCLCRHTAYAPRAGGAAPGGPTHMPKRANDSGPLACPPTAAPDCPGRPPGPAWHPPNTAQDGRRGRRGTRPITGRPPPVSGQRHQET